MEIIGHWTCTITKETHPFIGGIKVGDKVKVNLPRIIKRSPLGSTIEYTLVEATISAVCENDMKWQYFRIQGERQSILPSSIVIE